MMLSRHIDVILIVSGAVTALMVLQYLLPGLTLRLLSKIEIQDEAGRFYAQHWGILAFVVGGLLIYAGIFAAHRPPVVLAALIEKAGLVALVALRWRRPFSRGLRLPAAFDLACVVIYALYLLGLA